MTTAIDLSQLSAPEVIESLDFETLLAELKADLVARLPEIEGVINLESEPLVKALETGSYRELNIRARINDAAKALLLAFAKGADLDHIGVSYYQLERLTVTEADPTAIPPVAAVMETDDDYRYRCSLRPEGYSVAGPTQAYESLARNASGKVADARATSPEPGTTQVFILSREGDGTPTQDLLDTVKTALSQEEVCPESEEILVSPAVIKPYTLRIGLTLFSGALGEPAQAGAQTDLAAYADAHYKLKNDIIRSAIDAAAHQPGVKEVTIDSPTENVLCGPGEAPRCADIQVYIVGVEIG